MKTGKSFGVVNFSSLSNITSKTIAENLNSYITMKKIQSLRLFSTKLFFTRLVPTSPPQNFQINPSQRQSHSLISRSHEQTSKSIVDANKSFSSDYVDLFLFQVLSNIIKSWWAVTLSLISRSPRPNHEEHFVLFLLDRIFVFAFSYFFIVCLTSPKNKP